jgi:hypothetical protein
LAAFLPPSSMIPFRRTPIPGIHPGADTTAASASGTIRSRSLSPADKRFRPIARVPVCSGFTTKLADRSVRCEAGCRA